MASDITLTCPNVNSGTAVSFQGATVKYAWKNLTRSTPLTGQSTLAEVQKTGFENPKIIVTGFINTNESTTNIVTQSLMIAFSKIPNDAEVGNKISFSVSTGSQGVYLRNTADDANSVQVVVDSFSIGLDAGDAELGHFWKYTMTLTETA